MATETAFRSTLSAMIWANIWSRPVRTLLSVVAIALQVFLVLFVIGLTSGILSEWGKRVEGIGADLLVQPPNASIFFALSNALMPEDTAKQLRDAPTIARVAPVLLVFDPGGFDLIYGIDYDTFNGLSSGFLYHAGRPFASPHEVIIDDYKARSSKVRVGDKVTLLDTTFTVSGIVEHGKGARYFIPLRTAQEIAGAEGRVSLFYIRAAGDIEAARRSVLARLPRHEVRSMKEFLTLMSSSNLPELKSFTRSMMGLGILISFLVVFLTMHTVVVERTREIGILKALGASRREIVGLLAKETLVIAVLGIAVGLAATFGVQSALRVLRPTVTVLISLPWVFGAIGLALLGALLGMTIPALRASGFDPVRALSYE
jgi:putative ABC transport system permease protein